MDKKTILRVLIAVAMLLITGARLGQAYGYRRAFLAVPRAAPQRTAGGGAAT